MIEGTVQEMEGEYASALHLGSAFGHSYSS